MIPGSSKYRRNVTPPALFYIFVTLLVIQFLVPFGNVEGTRTEPELVTFMDGEAEQFADVRPGSENSVTFPGLINTNYFSDDSISSIKVELKARTEQFSYTRGNSVATNWDVEVNPAVIELQKGELKKFDVTVVIPHETSYAVRGELTVYGKVTTYPDEVTYSINEAYGVIRIQYYEDWVIKATDLKKSVEKGEYAIFTVNIINQGNGKDVFFQTVDNDIELKKSSIFVDFPVNIELDEKSVETMEIKVDTSSNTPVGEYSIEFFSYPVDVDKDDAIQNPFYRIKFDLIIEQTFVEKYLYPSVIVTIIVIIVVGIKIFRKKKKPEND